MKAYESQTLINLRTLHSDQLVPLSEPVTPSGIIQEYQVKALIYSCLVCHYAVITGNSIQLKNRQYCHHGCFKYIYLSGRLKPTVPHEGSRPPTEAQRASHIKVTKEGMKRQANHGTLRQEAIDAKKYEEDLSLVDYLPSHK